MTDDSARPSRLLTVVLAIVLSGTVIGGATDIWLDAERWPSMHIALELLLVTLSAGGLVMVWRAWRESAEEAETMRSALGATQRTLVERQAERDHWRQRAQQALTGLAEAINAQFDAWSLTAAERDVALLLLQGLGHKQIAAQTQRSERTVRQHAVSVYAKAGLSSRAELAAYFLQDLKLPAAPS